MADKKITELTNYNPPIDTDIIPIVDITTTTNKKITWANIKAAIKTYLDTFYMRLTGNETIAGIKTFSSSPIVPTPTTDMQVSTKKYVDDGEVSDHGDLTGLDGDDHEQYHNDARGDLRYLYKENEEAFTPDADYEPATKKYVDDNIGGGGGGGGDNIILNPSFIDSDADNVPNFWTPAGNPAAIVVAPDTLFPSRGGNQLEMTGSGIQVPGSSSNWLKVLPSTEYTFSMDYKVAAEDGLFLIIVSYNGDVEGSGHVIEVLTSTTATRAIFTFTTDADATNLNIVIVSNAEGDIFYISHPKLEEGGAASPYVNNKYVDRIVVGIEADLDWAATKALSN